jgi:predicted S18 family serine protease
VAHKLFPGSKEVEMVHPANVSGSSSTLAWGLASVIAGEPSIASKGLIAATGTLFPSGQVGAVGSVDVKAEAVQVAESLITFTPAGQAADALETFRLNNSPSIPIGVSKFEQAVGVLCVLSLSSASTCDQYLGLSSENDTEKNYLSVRLLSSNKWLCTSLRFSENTDLNNIGCSRVFYKGLWYIELTSFKPRY